MHEVAELGVAEGDRVVAGQPLIRLDETSALASQRALFLRRTRPSVAVPGPVAQRVSRSGVEPRRNA